MNLRSRRLLIAGTLLMALATATGAFGAHVLRDMLPERQFSTFQTAVQYQFFHSLGLLGIGWLADRLPGRWIGLAGALVVSGILLFSGSLYAILAGAPALFGIVTPIGGVCLIAGWLCAAFAVWRGAE